jgi:hypothetical protein
LIFIDLNRVHYFKLGHITFVGDRRSVVYHTVKQFSKGTPDDGYVGPKHVVKVKRRK